MGKVIALFVADLHLTLNPPVARSAEPDWLEAQARPLRQLCGLKEKYDCPIICAGDVFDKHNAGPQLINWAIANLPEMYAVPGQHDLPLHRLEDVEKSAYWTLVEAGTLNNIRTHPAGTELDGGLFLWGFPFGVPVERCTGPVGKRLDVAVIHSYIWTKGNQYTGAPEDAHVSGYTQKLQGWDVAVFGDNHNGFFRSVGDCEVHNCGCLIRRKRDERKYEPAVGLLWENGQVQRHFLDVSEDKWLEDEDELPLSEAGEQVLMEFVEGLGGLDVEKVGFADMVRRCVADETVTAAVGKVMLQALEETNDGVR